jgi:hypothetical protein
VAGGDSEAEGDISTLFQDEEADWALRDNQWYTVTSTGRKIRRPKRLVEEASPALSNNPFGDDDESVDASWFLSSYHYKGIPAGWKNIDHIDLALTKSEPYGLPEFAAVGAGTLGENVRHTDELKPMKFKKAMETEDKIHWEAAVEEEYERFQKSGALKTVPIADVPRGAKVVSTTWAMKKKANGRFRARLNMRGNEQMPNVHYDPAWTSAPVAGVTTIRCVFILMLITGAYAHIVDVMGAFLLDQFQNGEQIFTTIPEGWERFFPSNVLLLLLKTIYGLKQAANCFYILLINNSIDYI